MADREKEKLPLQSLIEEELRKTDRLKVSETDPSLEIHLKFRFHLKVIAGPDAGKETYILRKKLMVGRGPVDFPLRDKDVSRMHASFEVTDDGQVLLRDLGSTNGTLVNGDRVADCVLQDGDSVKMGETVCQFRVEEQIMVGK